MARINRRHNGIAALALALVVILWVNLSGSPCLADLYSGSLYGTADGSGDLMTTDGWKSDETSISWSLTRDIVDGVEVGPWHYEYTFTTPIKDLSHLILQVSYDEGGLDPFDVYNEMDYSNGPIPEGPTLYGPSPGNPYFPEGADFYGIKFNVGEGDVVDGTWTLTFDSWRNPMWGSFYAKDGTLDSVYATAWNSGLQEGGTAFIAVPDTSYVPVPGAAILGLLGLGIAGLKLRKLA